MDIIGRYSASMSGFSHSMSSVPSLKKRNDVVDQWKREGICDDVSEKGVAFLRFFDLIHIFCMPHNPHL